MKEETVSNPLGLNLKDDEEYILNLRGMDIKRLVLYIMKDAEDSGGIIRRSWKRMPRDSFHSLVQDGGNVDSIVWNETLLWALQEAEAQEEKGYDKDELEGLQKIAYKLEMIFQKSFI